MQEVIEFANKGGFVLGVCNGFQILCEAGLLPGALLHNNTRKFICRNVHIKAMTDETFITSKLNTNKALKIPNSTWRRQILCARCYDERDFTITIRFI